MFGLTLTDLKFLAMGVAAIAIAAFTAVVTHKVDDAKYEQLVLNYAQAQTKALQLAKVQQAAQDQLALNSAVAEAAAQQKIVTQTVTITKEVTKHVTDTSTCITWGLVRVLDASALGRNPSDLILPTGQSDASCAPIKASVLAASVASNYGTALSNAEQLNALEALIRNMVAASQSNGQQK